MSEASVSGTTVKLCDIGSLADGDIASVEIDGREIAYALIAGEFYAIDDTCSHARVSLSAGIVDVDDLTIECPKHGAVFSLQDGAALTLPAIRPVCSHETEVRDTEVWVSINTECAA